MREALHEDAGGCASEFGAGLAFDGGGEQAFPFAVKLTIVPVDVAIGAGEDEEAAAFFDELVEIGLGAALQLFDVGEDDDFGLLEVVVGAVCADRLCLVRMRSLREFAAAVCGVRASSRKSVAPSSGAAPGLPSMSRTLS
jgi:hypothetical protein